MKYTMMLIVAILFAIFILSPSQYNPFTPKGEIEGEFIKAFHRDYGDSCGQYPQTSLYLKNTTYDKKHFYGNDFYFGNNYVDVDKMKVEQTYKISYHQSNRPSDASSGDTIYYWVINNIEKIN